MRCSYVGTTLLASSHVAYVAALGVQQSFQQLSVNVRGDGALVRNFMRKESSVPDGLEWSPQTLRQTGVWPIRDWTSSGSHPLDMDSMGDAGRDLARENMPAGVVCPTWLHPDIQRDNLKPFVKSAGVPADGFVAELSRLCGAHDGIVASYAANYSGSWNDQAPQENDVRILQGVTRWAKQEIDSGKSKQMTWDHFSKPDKGHGLGSFVQRLMTHPTNISVSGPTRILDLGCGGGTDIVAIQAALKAKVKDTLCLDVYPVKRPEVTPFLLDASSPSKYHDSLAKALVGNENTVHVAVSMVAFHHIPDPKMRKDALVFLRKVLHPGGIFIMAEWDNSVKPDRWIHYDLVHLLPNMLFKANAPTKKSSLKMGTKYNSVKEWIATAHDAGLHNDEARSRAHGLSPQDQAALPGNANRDFHVVFGKGMESPKAVVSPKYK